MKLFLILISSMLVVRSYRVDKKCPEYLESAKEWYEDKENIENYVKNFGNWVSEDQKIDYVDFLSLLPQKAKVIDVAIGSGRDYAYFIKKGHEVYANEFSKELANSAKDFLKKSISLN